MSCRPTVSRVFAAQESRLALHIARSQSKFFAERTGTSFNQVEASPIFHYDGLWRAGGDHLRKRFRCETISIPSRYLNAVDSGARIERERARPLLYKSRDCRPQAAPQKQRALPVHLPRTRSPREPPEAIYSLEASFAGACASAEADDFLAGAFLDASFLTVGVFSAVAFRPPTSWLPPPLLQLSSRKLL